MPQTVSRLYTQFQPESYELSINLDRAHMTFGGSVTITGRKTGRPSKRLTFHGKDLTITSATVIQHDKKHDLKNDREIIISRINQQKSFHEIRLHSDDLMYPGAYTITITFDGTITPGMTGLYPCYFKIDDQELALLATQFESHHAREVFPCIDEPEAKATFDLTLTTEPGITTLANTPVKQQQTDGDTMTTTFETTPRMSSYLLAWVVGDMQSKSAKTKQGTEVAVWSTKAQPIDSLDFGLDVAVRSIEFFEDYFGVAYPLAKADHVALPDFSSGAMENWGLITYRERVLLAYPGEASQSVRETIATVVAHETSHQWFGNLVTMKWWNDLWLNESFANMMEYQAVDAMFPDWQIWDTFVAAEGLSALRRDATPGVQAVRSEVNHPDEISTLFDPSIVYAKGGRLLYMLKNYIGEAAFRSGLSNYFTKFAYKNTEGADLWDELSQTSGIDVAAFMNPWLTRNGFPVISVSQQGGVLNLTQSHFSDNPEKADPERTWPVPLFAATTETAGMPETNADQALLPTQFDVPAVLIDQPDDAFVRINQGAKGHYIVEYKTAEQRQKLVELIKSGALTSAERLMVLNDASMLSRAGYQSYGEVLTLLDAYKDEANESVWDIIALIIAESRRFVDQDDTLDDKIKGFVRNLIEIQYQRLGWEGAADEAAADQKLRATILALGAYAEHPEITHQALKRFAAYQSDQSSLSSEIRGIVFGVPVKQDDQTAFDYLLQLHDKTSNSDLKADISAALTATRSADKADLLLQRIKDPKVIKPQDADRWLVYIMRNRYVRDIGWDFMIQQWEWIVTTYSNDKSYDYMPRYAAGGINTAELAKRFTDFFEPKQNEVALKRNIQIGMEEINNRLRWMDRDLAAIQNFYSPS